MKNVVEYRLKCDFEIDPMVVADLQRFATAQKEISDLVEKLGFQITDTHAQVKSRNTRSTDKSDAES
jgi:hypothetical protein